MQLKFSTLTILTLISLMLLVPFLLSPMYLDVLRDRSFDLHRFLRGEVYKQGTGYAALVLVGIEMLLTARKRSRTWPLQLKLPGSVMLWRSAHIFTGVALLVFVVIHTVGVRGINYNLVLLGSFIGVTFTALLGVLAETGVLESPRKMFSLVFSFSRSHLEGVPAGIGKGALIRGMRAVWLKSHIFLVSVFSLLLAVHIFLVYYYR